MRSVVCRRPNVLAAEMERHDKWRPKNRLRRYALLANMIAGTAKWLAVDGYVGDKIVVYGIESGLEVGTIRLTAAGKIVAQWVWSKGA